MLSSSVDVVSIGMAAQKKKLPPELDPIFPLPANTGVPPVAQGQGKEIMERDDPVVVMLPYRAFYFMWEHAERQGAKEYPKYVGTNMDRAAQTWLDAVHAFRNAAAGQDLKRYSESKAQKGRSIRKRMLERAAEAARAAKAAKAAKKKSAEAPGKPSEPRKQARPSPTTRKPTSRAQKGSKRAPTRKPRKRKAKR